jgi:DNA modification methylase
VRLMGDGPSNWTTWLIIAARPRERHKALWGTKRGAYVLPEGTPRDRLIPGSKPLWLMRELVLDYSREGELVADPFAGAGTTLLAARLEGRRAIGAEIDRDTYTLAHDRLSQRYTPRLPFAARDLEPAPGMRGVAP